MGSYKHLVPTREDLLAAFNLFCGVFGIGTLGMPANFARAGPVLGCIAVIFMGLANIYGAVICSKTMLMAPRSVKTFGDMGEWVMGKWGRFFVLISQMGVCCMLPCAFLVLGGDLLNTLFPGAFSNTFWIILMALMVLPICLTPTMKEGAGAAFAGCMGTIVADCVGVAMLVHGMAGHPPVPVPQVKFDAAATTFGNLALAYGAATLVPSIQRQHTSPQRMPGVVFVTMSIITILFVALAAVGYSAVGCQISGNLLYSIFPEPNSNVNERGMPAAYGPAVLAYLFMQLHISIAFSVFMHPMFYIAERLFLGMHRHAITADSDEDPVVYRGSETPVKRTSSVMRMEERDDDEDLERAEYKGQALRYVTLRIVLVVLLVITAVLLQDSFVDLSDFVGASTNASTCIIMPIILYSKAMGAKMPTYERVIAYAVAIMSGVLAIYVSYTTAKAILIKENKVEFPYCAPEHQRELYYIKP